MADITLSAGVRQNLLSLQGTADLMATTQNRLATGKKVNSALDNPTNFFTSQSLSVRAGDMSALMDNMTAGIKTLEAADNGLTAITKTIESMQSTMRQARQDRSFQTSTYVMNMPASPVGNEVLSFTGGAFGATTETVDLTNAVSTLGGGAFTPVNFENGGANDGSISFSISANGSTPAANISITYAEANAVAGDAGAVTAAELVELINTELTAAGVAATAVVDGGGQIDFVSTSATSGVADVTISAFAAANGATTSGLANGSGTDVATAKTTEELVSAINNDTDLRSRIRASNDDGRLRIENLSTQQLDITGFNASGEVTGGATTQDIAGNSVRANLAKQYNELRDQLNKLADDASYNGVNLLGGDLLKLTFNETGSSTIDIQAKDENDQERPINTSTLGLTLAEEAEFDSQTSIDDRLEALTTALGVIRSQSSNFGSNLSIVENRTEFTKAMINTLQTGADSLVLADTNEEAANMLALQTRQQLSQTALSLASQADQAVLRLFG